MKTTDPTVPMQKLTIRLPKELEELLRQLAIEHQRSLNSELIVAVQQYVKQSKEKHA